MFFFQMERMDEIAVALKQFGDDKSTLLDQYERLSFEIQLNQAILGRSLSEPGIYRHRAPLVAPLPPPPALVKNATQGKRHSSTTAVAGFRKVVKKLLKPFVRRKQDKNEDVPTPKEHKFQKIFRTTSIKIKQGKNDDLATPKDHKFHKILRSMSVRV